MEKPKDLVDILNDKTLLKDIKKKLREDFSISYGSLALIYKLATKQRKKTRDRLKKESFPSEFVRFYTYDSSVESTVLLSHGRNQLLKNSSYQETDKLIDELMVSFQTYYNKKAEWEGFNDYEQRIIVSKKYENKLRDSMEKFIRLPNFNEIYTDFKTEVYSFVKNVYKQLEEYGLLHKEEYDKNNNNMREIILSNSHHFGHLEYPLFVIFDDVIKHTEEKKIKNN